MTFPTLGYLFSSYMHQDMDLRFADEWAVIPAFLLQEEVATLQALEGELAELFGDGQTPESRREALRMAPRPGWAPADLELWLGQLRQQLGEVFER